VEGCWVWKKRTNRGGGDAAAVGGGGGCGGVPVMISRDAISTVIELEQRCWRIAGLYRK
jgi:hypothetical protein